MIIGENIGKKILIEVEVSDATFKASTKGFKIVRLPQGQFVELRSATPCYPLPGGKEECDLSGLTFTESGQVVNKPSEPAFKFGDEVEARDGNDHEWCRAKYFAFINDHHFVVDLEDNVESDRPQVWQYEYIRPIPAKPTLEQVIEDALWNYEVGVNRNLEAKELRKNFVSRIKAAIEEEGKHE